MTIKKAANACLYAHMRTTATTAAPMPLWKYNFQVIPFDLLFTRLLCKYCQHFANNRMEKRKKERESARKKTHRTNFETHMLGQMRVP